MPRRKQSKLDMIAQKLLQQNHASIMPGEYEYVAVSARLIRKQLDEFYAGNAQPPEEKTIKNWFYQGSCPDWAIAILSRVMVS